jgi:hypothetical protein
LFGIVIMVIASGILVGGKEGRERPFNWHEEARYEVRVMPLSLQTLICLKL